MWRGQWEDLESQARILGGEPLRFWERERGGAQNYSSGETARLCLEATQPARQASGFELRQ